jgi:hypothetical protein
MRSNTLFKKLFACFAIVLTIATSCKRTEIPVTPEPAPTSPTGSPVNDATQVTASVSGIVLDESNVPVANAVVTSGVATTTTNSNGMFIFQNISLSKENGSITAVKAGYFKGIRSFKTTAGKNHTVRLQLMARVLSGTVNAAVGGTITSNGGATIVFPANAFVTSAGAAYTGTVSVYSRWIDPTAANLPFVIPGDLRGVSTTGVENILETYGMVGAELADASGNILKIATGKTATVSFPIPASLSPTAPASILLWHFDEVSARWKENGTATKNGSTYTAQVDKFSFWNCDVANGNFINLDYTLINAATNSPLVSTSTRIKRVSNGTYGYGITNNAGFVSGLVPKNEALILEVIASNGCGNIFYSQNIGPFASNTSLGIINVTTAANQVITFTGTLVNCSGAPVTNGYLSLFASGGYGGFTATSPSGTISFSIPTCNGASLNYNYQGTDYSTSQQSITTTGNAISGNINLGNVIVCGSSASSDVYLAGSENGTAKTWKNGIATNLSVANGSSSANCVFVSTTDVYVAGNESQFAKIWKNGIGTNLSASNTTGVATSVYVSGTDVYVVGYEDNLVTQFAYVPKLWKNGVSTVLTIPNGYQTGIPTSVFVKGSDVYIAGYIYSAGQNSGQESVVWKNGNASILNVNGNNSGAKSIFVEGTDVYVAGELQNSNGGYNAGYWKNGVPTYLSNNTSEANCVFVSNSDVYVAGYELNSISIVGSAKYWKNGIGINVISSSNMQGVYKAKSIFIKNTDVYVGTNFVSYNINDAAVWKNGTVTNFFNPTNYNIDVKSIFVK